MKIEIDLSDAFAEDGESLKDAVIGHITYQVKSEVWAHVRKAAEEQIVKQATEAIKAQLETRIAATIDALLASGEIAKHGKQVKMTDHIAGLFNESSQWNSVSTHVAKLAEGYAVDLKKRYDIIFANRIVMKINEEGLLKEEVAKLLLSGS